ncbi:MAG TPA: hypothetical protein VJH24_02300 [Candidatus Bilamarchaeaceae archaeon]|nr:hypothetical protein [Candidatus Bilamarchaeaceae archaeon]
MSFIGNIGKAISLLIKTWPFIAIRFAALLAASVISFVLFVILIVALILFGMNDILGLGILLAIILFAGFSGIFSLLARYFLFLYDAGHVAVMAKILKGEGSEVPSTMKQLDYGKDVVIKRIGSLSVLYVFKAIVWGILRAINRAVGFLSGFLPGSIRQLIRFVMAVINRAIFLIFDMILSYLVFAPAKNAWLCAADALVIYKKNIGRFLGVAAFLVIGSYTISYLGVILGYALFFAAYAGVTAAQDIVQVALVIFALIFLFMFFEALRQCLVIPFSRALVLCEFYETLQKTTIGKEDYGILNDIPQFRDLLAKAKSGA